jgi:hypothetical protein
MHIYTGIDRDFLNAGPGYFGDLGLGKLKNEA